MANVVMYSASQCPFCQGAEALLRRKGAVEINKIEIDKNRGEHAVMVERTGRRTVPQIFIDDTHVGGFDDLVALDRQGHLDALLAR